MGWRMFKMCQIRKTTSASGNIYNLFHDLEYKLYEKCKP